MGGYIEFVQTGHSISSRMTVAGVIPGAVDANLSAAPPWGLENGMWRREVTSSSSTTSLDGTQSTLRKLINETRGGRN
ncbi:hypothetical protein KSP40_PGU020332 [Platanthera guangdongensis]|uniref:Uncharacterized protein n=1 Tax=Platanthera guangdongensis TaxID=2320717 RepID=A0ABR2LCV4_9ASPA